jgi:hypothetical protein
MPENFFLYKGQFYCQKCNDEVSTCRLWKETRDLTWMCNKKHISKISLIPKGKKDYEDE